MPSDTGPARVPEPRVISCLGTPLTVTDHAGALALCLRLARGDRPAAVEFCIREEWATTLDDLIERRLMLSFHERLSREAITDVAEILSSVGRLAPDRVAEAIDGCVGRLEERYGRIIPGSHI